jgi:hypothetical protein
MKTKSLLALLARDPGDQFLVYVSSKDKADFLAGFLHLSNIPVAASGASVTPNLHFKSKNPFFIHSSQR